MSSRGSKLLSRDEFREGVFARDKHKCVVCGQEAKDAHHLLERRLFADGGYYLENGVSLCSLHHMEAETTELSVEKLRADAGITKIVLPEHFEPGTKYDKWGNVILANKTRSPGELFREEPVQKILAKGGFLPLFTPYVKYPRTWHLPWSPGASDDDKILPDTSIFTDKNIVVTRKEDGENTTIYRDYIHARSLDSRHHPSRTWVKALQSRIGYEIPEGWRLCGENLQAKHSIDYDALPSYFLLFAIYDENNVCLDWQTTKDWAELLEIDTVEELYRGPWNEDKVKACKDAPSTWSAQTEGYVVRVEDAFSYPAFRRSVAKYVRPNHVQSDQHWMHQEMQTNGLAE